MWPVYMHHNYAYVPGVQSGGAPSPTQPDSYALRSFHATHRTQPVQWAQGPAISLTHPQQQAWFNYHLQQPSWYYWYGSPEDATAPLPQSYRMQPPNHAERPHIPKESSGLGTQHGEPRATSGYGRDGGLIPASGSLDQRDSISSLKDLQVSETDMLEYQDRSRARGREEREQPQQMTRSRRGRSQRESQGNWGESMCPRVGFQETSNPKDSRFLRKLGLRTKSREQYEMEGAYQSLSKPTS